MKISRTSFIIIVISIAIIFSIITPVRAYSEAAGAWYSKGITETDSGNYSGAVEAFEKAIILEPDYFEAWNGKADALNRAKNYQDALIASNQALMINSYYVQGWINRGYILYNLGRYDEELNAYDRAIDIDPQNTDAWFNRGYALAAMHRYEEAIRAFDRVAELDPNYPNLLANKRIAEKNRDKETPFLVKYAPWIGISLLIIGGVGILMYKRKKRK
jgi:tetratricopeptide (TPR) repeat protein